jgi:hypothetical protein
LEKSINNNSSHVSLEEEIPIVAKSYHLKKGPPLRGMLLTSVIGDYNNSGKDFRPLILKSKPKTRRESGTQYEFEERGT